MLLLLFCFIFSKASNWCHRIVQMYTFIDSGSFDRIDRLTYKLISILNFMLWIFVRQLLNCLPALGIPMRHRPIHFFKTKIEMLKQYLLGPSTESSSDSRESFYIQYRTKTKITQRWDVFHEYRIWMFIGNWNGMNWHRFFWVRKRNREPFQIHWICQCNLKIMKISRLHEYQLNNEFVTSTWSPLWFIATFISFDFLNWNESQLDLKI